MVLRNTSQIMRWQPATHGKRIGLIRTRRRESYITGRIKEELGSFISTIIATNLREGFRWNITQDNSNDEIDGFKISHSWQHVNHETWIQIIKNDIIPPPMIRKKELHSGLQYEESLSFLEKNLDEKVGEGIKSLMDHYVEPPWRTPLNKRMIKRKERVVENTRWSLVKI